jgi:predicted RNase H-like HicB family nuclease
MNIAPIRNEEEYEKALKRIEVIFHAKSCTPDRDELEALSLAIEEYEYKHYPVDQPDPAEVEKFRMDQMNIIKVITEKTEGGYTAYVPDLPGCTSFGENNIEALKRNIKEAIEEHIKIAKKHNQPIPEVFEKTYSLEFH